MSNLSWEDVKTLKGICDNNNSTLYAPTLFPEFNFEGVYVDDTEDCYKLIKAESRFDFFIILPDGTSRITCGGPCGENYLLSYDEQSAYYIIPTRLKENRTDWDSIKEEIFSHRLECIFCVPGTV